MNYLNTTWLNRKDRIVHFATVTTHFMGYYWSSTNLLSWSAFQDHAFRLSFLPLFLLCICQYLFYSLSSPFPLSSLPFSPPCILVCWVVLLFWFMPSWSLFSPFLSLLLPIYSILSPFLSLLLLLSPLFSFSFLLSTFVFLFLEGISGANRVNVGNMQTNR